MIAAFLRSFVIVTLTAMNVSAIATGHYKTAFACATVINFVWWVNAHRAAADPSPLRHVSYALGGGCGTVMGMLLARGDAWTFVGGWLR